MQPRTKRSEREMNRFLLVSVVCFRTGDFPAVLTRKLGLRLINVSKSSLSITTKGVHVLSISVGIKTRLLASEPILNLNMGGASEFGIGFEHGGEPKGLVPGCERLRDVALFSSARVIG